MKERYCYARWLFLAALACGVLSYIGLFKGSEYLFARGHVPAIDIAGGFVLGLCAPVLLVWAIKVMVFGNSYTRETAALPPIEAPWWTPHN